jgi:hypothetical protein
VVGVSLDDARIRLIHNPTSLIGGERGSLEDLPLTLELD